MKQKIPLRIFGCIATAALSFSVAIIPALADQCAYISKEQAAKAIARLNLKDRVYFLCEPCGEEIPELAKIRSLSAGTVDYQDYWQVSINGRGIDLAYVFVDSGIESNFANLAAISDCPARRVSPVLPGNKFNLDSEDETRDESERN